MSLEAFLARLYSDPKALARFLADPEREVQRAELSEDEKRAVLTPSFDRDDLQLAAKSYSRKRAGRRR